MSASTATLADRARRFMTASLARELGIVLTLSVLFPFWVHLLPVPDDVRLGPKLLPMFYAPLLASLLGRKQSALAVALLAPWLNWALTGHPIPRTGGVMTVQLITFVVVLRGLLGRIGPHWYLAAPAYFGSLAAATLAVALLPGLIGGRSALEWAASSVTVGAPGIAILLLINWLAVRSYPTGRDGGGPQAA